MSARGVPEFEYNLQLAREIEEALRQAGHRTLLIGEDGTAASLARRAPRAKGMDLFISVHHDSVQPRFLAAWEYDGAAAGMRRIRSRAILALRLPPEPAPRGEPEVRVGDRRGAAGRRASRLRATTPTR